MRRTSFPYPIVCKLLPCLLLAGLWECGEGAQDSPSDLPASLRVTLAGDPPPPTGCGEGEEPLPFQVEGYTTVTLDLLALDWNGNPHPYSGPVRLRVLPGNVSRATEVAELQRGVGRATVKFRLAHGRTRIWVEAVGPGSGYAAGASPPLCFARPRIMDIQKAPTSYRSPLDGQQVVVSEGTLIVTGVNSKGFYVTDASPGVEEWNGIFVFTFSNPTGISAGDRLCRLSGGVKEFLGFTEVVFPTPVLHDASGSSTLDPTRRDDEVGNEGEDYQQPADPREREAVLREPCPIAWPEVRGRDRIPPPVLLLPEDIPDPRVPVFEDVHRRLDRYEARLVRMEGLRVPAEVRDCDFDENGEVNRCFREECWAAVNPEDPALCATVRGLPECNAGGRESCSCNAVKETACLFDCLEGDCAEGSSIARYDQWTAIVATGGAASRIQVITTAIPAFHPARFAGRRIRSLTGHLKQIDSAVPVWAIEPRGPEDLELEEP